MARYHTEEIMQIQMMLIALCTWYNQKMNPITTYLCALTHMYIDVEPATKAAPQFETSNLALTFTNCTPSAVHVSKEFLITLACLDSILSLTQIPKKSELEHTISKPSTSTCSTITDTCDIDAG